MKFKIGDTVIEHASGQFGLVVSCPPKYRGGMFPFPPIWVLWITGYDHGEVTWLTENDIHVVNTHHEGDNDLLAAAAKAVGFNLQWKEVTVHDQQYSYPHLFGKKWNPLSDDGDAFRLAVKLGSVESMSLFLSTDHAMVDNSGNKVVQPHDINVLHDPLIAARRAIVTAAATRNKSA